MKRFLGIMLAICLVAVMGMVAFAADNTVTNFDAEDIAAYMASQDLSAWGITQPTLTKVADGVQVECDGSAQVQSFLIGDEAAVAAAVAAAKGGNTYLRVALKAGATGLSIRLTLNDANGGAISFENLNAKVVALDGTEVEYTTTDGGGFAADTGIVVPADFEGYVFFAVEDLGVGPAWGGAAFDMDSMTGGNFMIDVRGTQGSTYVLKSVVATDSTAVEAGEQGGDEPIQGTADISTIAFAAAAVVSCGALTFVKKRK